MSNYMHLECWSHEPHIVDDSWVGQHNEDLPAIRLALSDRIVSSPASCAPGAVERARNLAAFIHRHPNCDIRVVDEAGDDRTALEPDLHIGSHGIPRWSIDGIPIKISESAPNRCDPIIAEGSTSDDEPPVFPRVLIRPDGTASTTIPSAEFRTVFAQVEGRIRSVIVITEEATA